MPHGKGYKIGDNGEKIETNFEDGLNTYEVLN
jgi:hypothetical protein